MQLKRALTSVTLLPLLLASIWLIGCSTVGTKVVILHPIEKSDIFTIPKTAQILIKAGTEVKDANGKVVAKWEKDTTLEVEKTGWFISDFYLSEVAKARMNK